jgi:hypothetical protein
MKITIESVPANGLYRIVTDEKSDFVKGAVTCAIIGTPATIMQILATAICKEENARVFREHEQRSAVA